MVHEINDIIGNEPISFYRMFISMWIKIGCVHLHISKSYELTLDHNLLWNEFAHSLKDRKSQTFMNSLQSHVFKSMKAVVQIKSKSLIIKSVLLCRVPTSNIS